MQRIYGIVTACALVLISCQIASASDGHSLPWGDFLLRVINAAIFVGIIPPILMQDKLNAIVVTKAPMGDMPFSPPQQSQQPQAAPYQPPVQTPPRPQAAPVVQDAADEIRKYKELLDMGAITQEEFDAKKRQLLGL